MRKLFFLLLIPALFACEEKDLTSENPAPSKDNINIQTSFIYDTLGLQLDSIYTNKVGLEFFFTEVSLVFSNFSFSEQGDTVINLPEPFFISMENKESFIGRIPPGGYSGKYSLQLGLDSAEGLGFNAAMANDEALRKSSVFRADGAGIDQVIIKGKLFDPTNPLDSVGSIPFEYRLGTPLTIQNKQSDTHNFSVSSSSKIPFIIQVNLWPVFKNLNIYADPLVESNPDNLFDISLAQQLADSLQISLF